MAQSTIHSRNTHGNTGNFTRKNNKLGQRNILAATYNNTASPTCQPERTNMEPDTGERYRRRASDRAASSAAPLRPRREHMVHGPAGHLTDPPPCPACDATRHCIILHDRSICYQIDNPLSKPVRQREKSNPGSSVAARLRKCIFSYRKKTCTMARTTGRL